MKSFIHNRLRQYLHEQIIDGIPMNNARRELCNTMTVNSYQEVIEKITAAIGTPEQNPQLWARIKKPLVMLSQANNQIGQEKHTQMDGSYIQQPLGMTGDSMADEADTYWATIQTTLCADGPDFE